MLRELRRRLSARASRRRIRDVVVPRLGGASSPMTISLRAISARQEA